MVEHATKEAEELRAQNAEKARNLPDPGEIDRFKRTIKQLEGMVEHATKEAEELRAQNAELDARAEMCIAMQATCEIQSDQIATLKLADLERSEELAAIQEELRNACKEEDFGSSPIQQIRALIRERKEAK